LERAGKKVALVPGDPDNVKITTPEDWEAATRRAMPREGEMRIGHGYDVHRFGGSGPLRLGGLTLDGAPGLAGHSDADVVLHAAMDAVLGASGLPDIGHRFPPGDPAFAGADSAALARDVASAVAGAGWTVVNLDVTILAERPKIAPHAGAMRASIGACFGLLPDRVGLKATTLEGLGALGRGEGIACHAVALVRAREGR
jgi:2-C-methyl-D-erythritol 4-phosphate cytidylyltransferase/2-C-methyl-D-erythritol 2,4-cyclodiphosphate synthase